jgi:hypothetical protein
MVSAEVEQRQCRVWNGHSCPLQLILPLSLILKLPLLLQSVWLLLLTLALASSPPLPPRSRHPAIFHLFQPPFHLLDDHLPGIRFQFELVLERGLSCLNEGEVCPHLVEQHFKTL